MTPAPAHRRHRARWSAGQLVITIVLALVMVAACTSGHSKKTATKTTSRPTPSASPSSTPLASIDFADCTGQIAPGLPKDQAPRVSQLQFSCGHLTVPLNYADPNGKTTSLYVVKVHSAAQTHRVGSLMVNPGGPGASGFQLAVSLGVRVDADVLDHFDLIGFDPRGVFLSDPISCTTDAQKDAMVSASTDVRSPAVLAATVKQATAAAKACTLQYGPDLQYYNTEATARDMDRIRIALREETTNYLGFSYGTELGAVYAHLFPTRIRSMVLDGAIDPSAPEIVRDERQVAAFETAFGRFATDCATRTGCSGLGTSKATVTTVFLALMAAADKKPIATSRKGDTRVATGAVVDRAALAALYDPTRWNDLGSALLSARQGDAKGLFALVDEYNQRSDDGKFSNLIDANTAISCNDSTVTFTAAQVQQTARVWATKYPVFGLLGAASLLSCAGWSAARHPVPAQTAPNAKPILVIGTLGDPATPYAGAGALVATLGSGRLLTWDGQGHTAYLKTTCITSAVNTYLIDTTLPPVKTACPVK